MKKSNISNVNMHEVAQNIRDNAAPTDISQRAQTLLMKYMSIIPEKLNTSAAQQMAAFLAHYELEDQIINEFVDQILKLVDHKDHDSIYTWNIQRQNQNNEKTSTNN